MSARLNVRISRVLGIVCTVGILLLAVWLTTVQRLQAEKHLLQVSAQSTQLQLAQSMAGTIEQSLAQARLLSIAVDSWREPAQELERRLAALGAAARAFKAITLYDDKLRPVYQYGQTLSPAPDPTPDLHAALARHASRAIADIHLGNSPWPGHLSFYFPVGAAASPLGLLAVEMDFSHVLAALTASTAATTFVQLLHSDGRQLALLAPHVMLEPPLPPIRVSQDPGAPIVTDGRINTYISGGSRLSSLPLAVASHVKRHDVLAPYIRDRDRSILILVLLSAGTGLLTWRAVRNASRHAELLADLERTAEDKLVLIQQLEEEKRRAIALAAHDPLTGLPNRRLFAELATSHVAAALRSRQHCAVLYLDLDRFKEVNDTLGHHVGDLLLKEVAHRLQLLLRESDVVARLGGDEFAILLTSLDQEHHAELVAERIVNRLSEPYPDLGEHIVRTSPSVGVAVLGRHARDVDTLCQQADAAMYSAKRNGRGRYALYDPAAALADGRNGELSRRLPQAIAEDEFILHFQPRVSLYDYRVQGFEALLRWHHPEHGLIYPEDFLPVAELAGQAGEVSDWLVSACCRQLADWQDAGLTAVPLAVSITAAQLRDPTFAQRLAGAAARHGISPRLLEIQFTENCLLDAQDHAGLVLSELNRLGLHITLDDFGTGFSGLEHARRFPINGLKIHRGFIGDLRNSAYDAVIVTSIISMAHNLGLTVVADGVDLLHQLVHLKTARCDQAQGYLFSRPLAAEAATALAAQPTLRPG